MEIIEVSSTYLNYLFFTYIFVVAIFPDYHVYALWTKRLNLIMNSIKLIANCFVWFQSKVNFKVK